MTLTAILTGIAGLFAREVIQYIGGLISSYLAKLKKDKENHEAAVNQASQDAEKSTHINEGSKSDEIDAAIDDSSKHF